MCWQLAGCIPDRISRALQYIISRWVVGRMRRASTMHATWLAQSRLVLAPAILLHVFAGRRCQLPSCGARSSRRLAARRPEQQRSAVFGAGHAPEAAIKSMMDDAPWGCWRDKARCRHGFMATCHIRMPHGTWEWGMDGGGASATAHRTDNWSHWTGHWTRHREARGPQAYLHRKSWAGPGAEIRGTEDMEVESKWSGRRYIGAGKYRSGCGATTRATQ